MAENEKKLLNQFQIEALHNVFKDGKELKINLKLEKNEQKKKMNYYYKKLVNLVKTEKKFNIICLKEEINKLGIDIKINQSLI